MATEGLGITQNSEIELVDKGYDLLTPTNTIMAYTEVLLEYAEKQTSWQDFIPDLRKMLSAGEQLSTLITKLFSKKNTPNGELDLERFTSTIRHDLRTPINAIIGYGEMLLEDLDKETHPEASADLQKILTAARRLLTLIGDLSYNYKPTDPSSTHTAPASGSSSTPSNYTPPIQGEEGPTSTLIDEVVHSLRTPTTSEHAYNLSASLLVVDDKESNRDLLSRRLVKQGFTVEVAENGVQALDMVHTKNYDLVLLDIIMPKMNGYQVLAEIKADPKLSRIPVIMISALDEIDSVVRCIEMGAEDYLQKPFNQVILNAKISASLERKRLRDREYAFIKKLQIEQQKSEKLLLNILPKPIADRLKRGARTIADSFPEATVLFSDLVGFTQLCAGISATELIERLNEIFLAFDILTESFGLEKIKTIGDAYMLVGGLPTPRPDHAEVVADMALAMFDAIEELNKKNRSNFKIRVGIHTGPVVAGVIGKNKFNYDLWGDAVNIASRMESHGIPDRIQVSETTYQKIKDRFVLEKRGAIEVKGKGQMVTYWLVGKKH